MIKILLIILALSFSQNAFAEEKYECPVEKEKITNDLMKDVACTHDEECGWFDYGYPWQPQACMKAIVNTGKENHNITMLRLIEEYNQHCIYKDESEKKKYDDFEHTLQIKKCDIPRAYCYKGFCRTQSYATYNDK
jgi:hypothetical protein